MGGEGQRRGKMETSVILSTATTKIAVYKGIFKYSILEKIKLVNKSIIQVTWKE